MPRLVEMIVFECAFLLMFCGFAEPCFGQDTNTRASVKLTNSYSKPKSKKKTGLALGLSSTQIEHLIGQPSYKETKASTQGETWHYGASLVFLKGNKLIAWTDAGEISKQLKKMKKRNTASVKKTQLKDEKNAWIDLWKEKPIFSEEEILNDLLYPPPHPVLDLTEHDGYIHRD